MATAGPLFVDRQELRSEQQIDENIGARRSDGSSSRQRLGSLPISGAASDREQFCCSPPDRRDQESCFERSFSLGKGV